MLMFNWFAPKVFNQGYLPEEDGHQVFFMEAGSKDGKPVLVFHGGPGGASRLRHAEAFDRRKFRVVFFDQRGCGRSQPSGETAHNTTADLLHDAARLLDFLDIKEKVILLGGSWGATLALLFAEKYPEATIVASAKAIQMMPQFFEEVNFAGRTQTVKEGDTLCLGQHTLKFIMAPMVHWPEVMLTYEESEKILFSADAFGKFGALCHEGEWIDEARRYYFNIVGKYGAQVQALLKKAAGLDIAMICPLHGPVLKENLGYYIGLYDTWSKYEPETEGVVVAYASIHGNTAAAARRMAEILSEKGATEVMLIDLCRDDMALAVESAFRYSKMIVAASSYDAGVFPPMFDFLHHLQIKNFQKRRVGIIENGSWAPTAGRMMSCMLSEMKNMEIMEHMVTIKSSMKKADLLQMEELAEELLATE